MHIKEKNIVMMKRIKYFLIILWKFSGVNLFLDSLDSFLNHDAGNIVSKKGWEILNEKHNNTGWITISDYKRSLGR